MRTATQPPALADQPADTQSPEKPFQALEVATISAAHFVHDTYTAFLAPLLPILIENLSMTKTAAGLLTVFYQGPSLIQPLIGHLGDRVNLRLLVILAPMIAAAMLSLSGVAPTYAVLALLLVVAGFSSAGLHAIGPVLAGRLSGDHLGRGMSFWMVGGELGRSLGPVIVVAAVTFLTPRNLPWLMTGGAAASLILFFRLRRLPADHRPDGNGSTVQAALRRLRPVLFPLTMVITTRSLLFSALATFLPTFLTDEGAEFWFAGASLSVMEAAGVVGALAGGVLSDRLGRRRVMIIMTLAAPFAMLAFLNTRGWVQFPILILLGLTFLSTTPVLMAMVQERAPESRALANGIYMALNFVIISLAVLVVGLLGDHFGLRVALSTSALVMLAGAPFAFLLPPDVTKPGQNRFHR